MQIFQIPFQKFNSEDYFPYLQILAHFEYYFLIWGYVDLLLFHALLAIHSVRLLFELDLCPLELLFCVLVYRSNSGRYLVGDVVLPEHF